MTCTDRSKGHKVRRTAELDIERPVVGTIELEAALGQAERWIEQWDKLVWDRSSGRLLRSTPAHSARGRWRQGAWCSMVQKAAQRQRSHCEDGSGLGRADSATARRFGGAGPLGYYVLYWSSYMELLRVCPAQ